MLNYNLMTDLLIYIHVAMSKEEMDRIETEVKAARYGKNSEPNQTRENKSVAFQTGSSIRCCVRKNFSILSNALNLN